MAFEVRLPEKFIGVDVSSVYIHLNFEDFKPMVMVMQPQAEKVDEEFKLPSVTKRVLSQAENSNVFPANNLKKKNGPSNSIVVVPLEQENAKRAKAQTFQLNRMVPPSKEGIQFYYSLQNPKNFKREIFIDQYKKKVFVDDELRMKYSTPKQKNEGSVSGQAANGEETASES